MLKNWCRKAVCAIQTASNVSKYYLPTAFAPSSAIPSFISSPASIYPQNLYISLTQKHSISYQTPISIYIDHKLHKKRSGGRLKYFLIVVCDRGLCIKVVLCGQSSLSSKANVLCSICTNTVFSNTYFSKNSGFLSSDLGKNRKAVRKNRWVSPNLRQKTGKKSLSDDLSGFKGRKKSCRSSVWAWRCQQPDDYCFFL